MAAEASAKADDELRYQLLHVGIRHGVERCTKPNLPGLDSVTLLLQRAQTVLLNKQVRNSCS